MEGKSAPPEDLWFLNTSVRIRLAATEGEDGISILEHRAPHGDSPPLHVHRGEDEIFQVLDGEFRFQIGAAERHGRAGEILIVRQGTPHSYRVESENGGHWLTITAGGDFERFVRRLSRPAGNGGLPPTAEPTPEAIRHLAEVAAEHGIDIVGPPLH